MLHKLHLRVARVPMWGGGQIFSSAIDRRLLKFNLFLKDHSKVKEN